MPPKKGKKAAKKGGGGKKAAPAGKEKFFPLEKGPTPSMMEPAQISKLFKIPSDKFKTEEDVIKYHGYTLEEKLGQGGFGIIFFARDKKDLKCACKLMELGMDWKDSRVSDMKNELFIMEKVKHLYIVKLYCHFLTQSDKGNRLYIFMELADGGDFAKFVQKKGTLTEAESVGYFAQILCGINHMHSLGIAHRDIKLQNVLLAKNESVSITKDFILLLADFGLSRIVHHQVGGGGNIEMNRTVCGTPIFMAPEILMKKPYNAFSVDVWALGVTLYIMVTLELPFDFKDQAGAVKKMMARSYDYPTDKMKAPPSDKIKSFIAAMLEPEGPKRLTLDQCLTNPFMGDWFKKAQAAANKAK